jgi:uncharacterized protein YPO0396
MTSTTQTREDLKRHITQSVQTLRQLRDEIRVELHLANVDAKARWQALEASGGAAEKLADDLSEASQGALKDMVDAFKRFKASLSQPTSP